jgi:hypothetical protein
LDSPNSLIIDSLHFYNTHLQTTSLTVDMFCYNDSSCLCIYLFHQVVIPGRHELYLS